MCNRFCMLAEKNTRSVHCTDKNDFAIQPRPEFSTLVSALSFSRRYINNRFNLPFRNARPRPPDSTPVDYLHFQKCRAHAVLPRSLRTRPPGKTKYVYLGATGTYAGKKLRAAARRSPETVIGTCCSADGSLHIAEISSARTSEDILPARDYSIPVRRKWMHFFIIG